MRIFFRLLPAVILFSACVQIKADNPSTVQDLVNQQRNAPRRSYSYQVDISAQVVGFTLWVNGFAFITHDGNAPFSSRITINDWMISGENDIAIDLFWPAGVEFTPRLASASFRLLSNNSLVRQYRWPAAGIEDVLDSYPHTFSGTFIAAGFSRMLLERGERFNAISNADSIEINALANGLQRALNEGNFEAIYILLQYKYFDLAAARFTTPETIKTETETLFRELMEKDRFGIVPGASGNRFSYFLDNRVIRLRRGGLRDDPQPTFIITYTENNIQQRRIMELFFVKIENEWIIIRSLIR